GPVIGGRHVEGTQVLLPLQLAVERVAVETFGAEKRDHPFAIGRDGCVGVRRFRVAAGLGLTSMRGLAPENFTGLLIEAIEHPFLLGVVIGRVAAAVQPDLKRGFSSTRDSSGDEQLVSYDDGARMTQSRDRRLPLDIANRSRARIAVPTRGRCALSNAAR